MVPVVRLVAPGAVGETLVERALELGLLAAVGACTYAAVVAVAWAAAGRPAGAERALAGVPATLLARR
jgi:hypothetical protein